MPLEGGTATTQSRLEGRGYVGSSAATVPSALLLETGDVVLTESGNRLILEA